jgi:hypothetical protein
MIEDYRKGDLNFIHDVTFKPGASILRLNNAADIDAFSKEYSFSIFADLPDAPPLFLMQRDGIRWDKVAERYQGILIPNYIWEKRMDPFWYYPWDCASGCIWNVDAIESIKCRSTESAGFTTREMNLKVRLKEAAEAIKRENKRDASSGM